MTAHQRIIRDNEAARDPRAVIPLQGCRVMPVPSAWSRRIILRYEWLGTMPAVPLACYGLIGPNDEALGTVVFGVGMGSHARQICGPDWADRVIVLERGACVHFAHEHAASFLIAAAVRRVALDLGKRIVVAYSDAEAGEIGTVYQACNWLYLGPSNGRGGSGTRQEGRRIGDEKWRTSKSIRRLAGREGYQDTALWWKERRQEKPPTWEFRTVPDRSRYVTFCGPRNETRAARAALRYPVLPYPKRILEGLNK